MNKKTWKEFIILTIGTLLIIIEEYFFKMPNHFTFGGVTGIAILLSGMFSGSPSTYVFLINGILIVLGFLILGKSFGIKSIYVSILFSVGLEVMQFICPMEGTVTDQPMLELVISFFMLAACSAVFFHMDASSGGTDIVALILKKYTNIPVGRALLVVDSLVVILSFFIYDVTVGLFSMVGFFAKSFMVDLVIEGLDRCKCFTIISKNAKPICDFIHDDLRHTATVHSGVGSYEHREKEVITTVVNRNQAVRLQKFVKDLEPQAFMIITNSSEVIGEGFRTRL